MTKHTGTDIDTATDTGTGICTGTDIVTDTNTNINIFIKECITTKKT